MTELIDAFCNFINVPKINIFKISIFELTLVYGNFTFVVIFVLYA